MPETDAEMMARLERMTTWDCDGYLSVEDSAAIRRALALIERYRKTLEEVTRSTEIWLLDTSLNPGSLIREISKVAYDALTSDPPPTETEAKS